MTTHNHLHPDVLKMCVNTLREYFHLQIKHHTFPGRRGFCGGIWFLIILSFLQLSQKKKVENDGVKCLRWGSGQWLECPWMTYVSVWVITDGKWITSRYVVWSCRAQKVKEKIMRCRDHNNIREDYKRQRRNKHLSHKGRNRREVNDGGRNSWQRELLQRYILLIFRDLYIVGILS